MTPLAPLKAPSALAAFAKTLDGGARGASPTARPQPLSPATTTSALKPLTVEKPTSSLQPLARAPSSKREVSALAAFAKHAISLSPTAALGSLGDAPKRPAPLAPMGLPSEAKAGETKAVQGEEENKELKDDKESRGEPKELSGVGRKPVESAAAKPQEDEKPLSVEEKAVHDSDEDSMAEFACMESDSDCSSDEERVAVDIDGLYDQSEQDADKATLSSQERIFIPQSSKQDLFHAILVKDSTSLTTTLSRMEPPDVLAIRDADGRTMYHYAAMSRSHEIQAVVFGYISCYMIQEANRQIAAVETKQRRLDRWKDNGNHSVSKDSQWISPRMDEIHTHMEREVTEGYLTALRAYDRNGRSFLHYGALNRHLSPVQVCPPLMKVLALYHDALLHKDTFERDALYYAAMADNLLAIDAWFTHAGLGESLVASDINRLAQLKMAKATQDKLFKLLEDCDTARFLRKQPSKAQSTGLSVYYLAQCSARGCSPSTLSGSVGTRMWTSLHKAVLYGNVDAVQHFIDQGASLSERDADGWTALHHCASLCSAAHFEIAKILLSSGANVNAVSLRGRTPLHLVAMDQSDISEKFFTAEATESQSNKLVACVALLCQHGGKLEVLDEDRYTPFLASVRAGSISVARFLLESGCNALATDKSGGCALHIAVYHKHEEMVRFLAWWDAQAPVWRFAKDHRGRLAKALARGDASIQDYLDNLWYGARLGDVDQVGHCIQLYQSIRDKRERTRHIWIDSRTARTQRTALHLAIEPFLDGKLHSTKATTSKQGTIQAARQIVVSLLHEGASLSATDIWGITPLMLAACIESHVIVEAMLKDASEKDLLTADSAGNLALHYSYAFCRAQTSSLLEAAMDDVDIENSARKAPFAVTAYRDKLFPAVYRAFLISRDKPPSQPALTAKSVDGK